MLPVRDERHQARMASLRAELAEKFPASPPRSRARFETGCAALDQTGGLLRGGVTEGCGAGGQ